MKTNKLRGVTRWKRGLWYWVPALVVLELLFRLLHQFPLVRWLGEWVAFGLTMALCVAGGLLAGLLGRWLCYLRANGRGPWILVDDSTIQPTSFYDTARYAPIGTGYAGYLCKLACVPPSHVYATYTTAHNTTLALEEAHINLMVPTKGLQAYNDQEWCDMVRDNVRRRPGRTVGFLVLPYYE